MNKATEITQELSDETLQSSPISITSVWEFELSRKIAPTTTKIRTQKVQKT